MSMDLAYTPLGPDSHRLCWANFGKMFLVIIDAHSKWLEVIAMVVCSASTTIQAVRTLFPHFGLPESIVSDNGPQFASKEFQEFCRADGIQQMPVAPITPHLTGWLRGLLGYLRMA